MYAHKPTAVISQPNSEVADRYKLGVGLATKSVWPAAAVLGALLLFAASAMPAVAAEKPAPFQLGRYIGWLVGCDAIRGSHGEVGRALRTAVERYKLWGYTAKETDTLVSSIRFGMAGRGKWDNGETICANLTSDKESVENIRKLIEMGR